MEQEQTLKTINIQLSHGQIKWLDDNKGSESRSCLLRLIVSERMERGCITMDIKKNCLAFPSTGVLLPFKIKDPIKTGDEIIHLHAHNCSRKYPLKNLQV